MSELAKAYVQIIPTAKGIKEKIKNEIPDGNESGKKFGSGLAGAIKNVIVAAGIGKAISSSISEGANLEQSIGGIETLFKESGDAVKKNAAQAYKTAGMSANEYMEITTSFSASLLQSLSGDTQKAADISNTAMVDMSDNANKMGTNMEDIKNAYQGFAKQNYTMLDNLKLGYGGTKTEMERLLKDAREISGVEYDINNLSDVYGAIHVIQGELGITGTTAKEASSTISGSFNSVKAVAKNVMGEIALGMDIGPSMEALGETVITFLAGNLLPAVGNILSGLPDLISGAISIAIQSMNIGADNTDTFVSGGIDIVKNIVTGILSGLPYLAEAAINLLAALGSALVNTDWVGIAQSMVNDLKNELGVASGEIFGTDEGITDAIMGAIANGIPKLLQSGVTIVTNIVNGILKSLPNLIKSAGNLVTKFITIGILPMLPKVWESGGKLLLNIVNGIIKNLPQIISAALKAATSFINSLGKQLPKFLQQGIEIIGKIAAGLIRAIPTLVSKIPSIASSVIKAFKSVNWLSIGKNIIAGIAKGLRNAGGQLWDAVKGVLGNFKDKVLSFFGIHSPATWGIYVGEMVDKGIAGGFIKNIRDIENAADSVNATIARKIGTESNRRAISVEGNGYVFANRSVMEKLDMMASILKSIASSETEIVMKANNREVARYMRELGVTF